MKGTWTALLLVAVQVPAALAEEGSPAAEEPKYHPDLGPATIDLGHDLAIDLPAEFVLFHQKDAHALLREAGNTPRPDTLALITRKDADWFVEVSYEDEGYVSDDDAQKLDADAILESIRKGTEAANDERKKRGFKPLHVDGWTQAPAYDRAAHHLVWGVKGSDEDGSTVNYNTRVLGRRGYASLNLVVDPEHLDASKPEVTALLAATAFKEGARYQDFDGSKDKKAEYGLAALIGGGGAAVAAVKLAKVAALAKFGAKILALLIAFKKAAVAVALGLFASLKKILGFRGRKTSPGGAEPSAGADPS
ncbi:MAG: DUF2167 domain-containing protein [Acidobacteriota bacterium]